MKRKKMVTEKGWGQYDTTDKLFSWIGMPREPKKKLPLLWGGEVWVRITLTYEVPK